MRLWFIILLAGMGASLTLSAEVKVRSDFADNYVAAIVNETIITGGQVEEFSSPALDALRRAYPPGDLLRQKSVQVLSEGLDQLIENQLILDDFKTSGAKVPDAMVEDEIKDRIRQLYHDRATLTKELQAKGMNQETLKQQIREDIILHYMRQKNVAAAITISPQKIEQYYTTNLHQFKLGNQIRLRMIVLNCSVGASVAEVRKLAQEIASKVDEGASFAEMAAIYSEGSQRKEGGDWGWREESKIIKGLSDVAAGLKPGEHSGVLGFAPGTDGVYWLYQYNKTGQLVLGRKYSDKVGEKNDVLEEKKFETPVTDSDLPAQPQEFHLLKVEEKRPARTESLTDVRERIEKDLLAQERERLRKKWVQHLRTKAFVRLFY